MTQITISEIRKDEYEQKELVIAIYPARFSGLSFSYGGKIIEELDYPFLVAIGEVKAVFNQSFSFGGKNITILLQDLESELTLVWQDYLKNQNFKFELIKGYGKENPLGGSKEWKRKNSIYATKLIINRNKP